MDHKDIRSEQNPQAMHDGIHFFTDSIDHKHPASPHIHQLVELLYVTSGSALIVSDDTQCNVTSGDMVLFRANAVHSIYPSDDKCEFSVLFISIPHVISYAYKEDGMRYSMLLSRFHAANKNVWRKEECLSLGICERFNELKTLSHSTFLSKDIVMKANAALIISAVLKDLSEQANAFEVFADSSESLSKKMDDAILYINEHYSEDLTVASMSERLFMSYSYFSRNFKRVTGRCFKDFLNVTRINNAEMKLRSTSKSVTQIAMECGYNNIAYFSAMYKKLKGISPTSARDTEIAN